MNLWSRGRFWFIKTPGIFLFITGEAWYNLEFLFDVECSLKRSTVKYRTCDYVFVSFVLFHFFFPPQSFSFPLFSISLLCLSINVLLLFGLQLSQSLNLHHSNSSLFGWGMQYMKQPLDHTSSTNLSNCNFSEAVNAANISATFKKFQEISNLLVFSSLDIISAF